MVTLQIVVDDETYFALLKKKGTKRSWIEFLKEDIICQGKKEN